MKRLSLLPSLLFVLILAGCSAAKPAASLRPTEATAVNLPDQSAGIAEIQLSERTDQQGAVSVVVKPQLWKAGSKTIDFEISMNTHSVNLSLDLATLSTLTTNTGLAVQASNWSAPSSGHHVSGILSFPAQVDGKTLLDETKELTLTIKNVDSAERVFNWSLLR